MGGLRELIVNKGYWGAATDMATRIRPAEFDPGAADNHSVRQQRGDLLRTIEDSIIPRLLVAHELAPDLLTDRYGGSAPLPDSAEPDAADVAAFTALVLAQDGAGISAFVSDLRKRGASLESLYLDLLAPTARKLGDMWIQDICDFTVVTVALVQLHDILRDLSAPMNGPLPAADNSRQILMLLCPGEQHMFGLTMAAEFFRHRGWRVKVGYPTSITELAALVRGGWYHIIGLSCSCDTCVEAAAAAVNVIRRESANDAVGVMVGGQLFAENPGYLKTVGADAAAVDGHEAVGQAEALAAEKA